MRGCEAGPLMKTFVTVQLMATLILANSLSVEEYFYLLFIAVYHSTIRKQTQATYNCFFGIIQTLHDEIQNNTNYVAGVVHDLRNPLSEIFSCAELLA